MGLFQVSILPESHDQSAPFTLREAEAKKWLLQTTQEVQEEEAAKEITVDAAFRAVLSELDGVLTLKEQKKTAPKTFLCGRRVFTLLLTGFGKSLAKHRGA